MLWYQGAQAKYWNTLLLQPRNTLYRVADSFSAVVVFIYSATGPMACNFANKMYICASRVKVPPPLDDSQTQRMPIRGTVRHAQRACEITIICRPKEHVCDTAGLFLPVLSIKYRQKGKNISRRLSALVLKTSIFKLFPSAIYALLWLISCMEFDHSVFSVGKCGRLSQPNWQWRRQSWGTGARGVCKCTQIL